MHDLLRTAATYAARSEGLSKVAVARFSRAAASRARTEIQLQLAESNLEHSRRQLSNASAALEATINAAALEQTAAQHARAVPNRPVARLIAPQLATLVKNPPSGPEWIHEISFEGYRLQCWRDGDQVWLLDLDGRDWSDRFPSLVTAIRSLKVFRACIDCAAVAFDDDGLSRFWHVRETMSHADDSGIALVVFDLLQLEGNDIRALPLLERKKRLRRTLDTKNEKIRYAAHLKQSGQRVLDQARLLGIDGIVSKRLDAPYMSGLGLDWRMSGSLRRH